MFKRISHVAIDVAGLERSVEFYERNFGFEKYFEHTTTAGLRLANLRLGDTTLELVQRADARIGGFHFCLETNDFGKAVRVLKKRNVKIVRPPHDAATRDAATEPRETGWRRAVFCGPDGEPIEIRG